MVGISEWDSDRQVVLTQLQQIILALRSNFKFGFKPVSASNEKPCQHPLLRSAMELHRRLLSCTEANSSRYILAEHCGEMQNRHHSNVGQARSDKVMTVQTYQDQVAEDFCATLSPSVGLQPFQLAKPTEVDILAPFCDVCRCPDIGEPIIIVALSAIDGILELSRSLVSIKGIKMAIDAALSVPNVLSNVPTHEVLLARTMQVCVTCMRHPAAAELPEDFYIRLVRRALVISLSPGTTALLKRSAESSMSFLVSCLYSRVTRYEIVNTSRKLMSVPHCGSISKRESVADMRPFSSRSKLPVMDNNSFPFTLTTSVPPGGASMMRYISSLIRNQVTALDVEGNIVFNENDPQKSHNSAFALVSDKWNPTIQLEGLSLAQGALLAMRDHRFDTYSDELLFSIKNDLCRALLIAAMNTAHTLVLALVLRITHIVVEIAGFSLVAEIYSFLSVIHLNPIMGPIMNMDFRNGSENSNTYAKPIARTLDSVSLLPLNAKSRENFRAGASLFDIIVYCQSTGVFECYEILLESLAEFFSDPFFCNFCFFHYDLSSRCPPLLPCLCDVFLEFACLGNSHTRESSNLSTKNSCHPIRHSSGNRRLTLRSDVTGNVESDDIFITRIQLLALDTATNMISNFASGLSKDRDSTLDTASDDRSIIAAWKMRVKHMFDEKDLLLKFAALFNESPLKKGIPFLLENCMRIKKGEENNWTTHESCLAVAEPAGGREIGACLYHLSPFLNKQVLGNYIGELGNEKLPNPHQDEVLTLRDGTYTSVQSDRDKGECEDRFTPGTVIFFEQQREGFIEQFKFDNKPLLICIRELVYHLCLPGESQKIDRIMEVFAKHWYTHNVNSEKHINPFHSESGAFVLSFAIIMLNTDLHSGKVQKSMTANDFRNINCSIDNGNNLPDEYLSTIYKDVKQHELVMEEMMGRGFANNVTWDLEMNRFNWESKRKDALFHDNGITSRTESIGVETPESMIFSSACDKRHILRDQRLMNELNPYTFAIIEERCFVIFKHLLGVSVSRVGRLNPLGCTVKDALDDLHAILHEETSALLSSICGIRMLCYAAAELGQHDIVDKCIMTLLSHIDVSFSNGMDAIDNLHRNIPMLLLLSETFSLLRGCAVSLGTSWPMLGNLVMNLFLLGLIRPPTSSTGQKACYAQNNTAYAVSVCLEKTISQCPDFSQQRSTQHPGNQQETGRSGGWLAVLWDSAFGWRENAAAQEAGKDHGSVQGFKLEARVQECIPDMEFLLFIIARLPTLAHSHLLRALMNSDCSSTSPIHCSETNLKSLPLYKLCFITACVVTMVSNSIDFELFNLYLAYLQETLTTYLTLNQSANPNNQSSDAGYDWVNQISDPKRVNAASLGSSNQTKQKVIKTILELLQLLLNSIEHLELDTTILQSIAKTFFSLPKPIFVHFVAFPLLQFLSLWVGGVCAAIGTQRVVGENDGQANLPMLSFFQSSCNFSLPRLLVDIIMHLEFFNLGSAVLSEVSAILLNLVRYTIYNVETETNIILKLTLSLEVLRENFIQENHFHALASSDDFFASCCTERVSLQGQDFSPQLVSSDEVSPVQIMERCGENVIDLSKRILFFGKDKNSPTQAENQEVTLNSTTSPKAKSELQNLWILTLRNLSTLVLSCPQGLRSRSEAMLALQRLLLAIDLGIVDAVTLELVYVIILLPLTETLCGISKDSLFHSSVEFATFDKCKGFEMHRWDSVNGAMNGGDWLLSLQELLLPSLTIKIRCASLEDKCRMISILSKTFLHHIPTLQGCPGVLERLWQRILITFYAMYADPSGVVDEALYKREEMGVSRSKLVQSGNATEDVSLVKVAVEETVKNMIYVLAYLQSKNDETAMSAFSSPFSISTRYIISYFPFSEPLLEFLDSLKVYPCTE